MADVFLSYARANAKKAAQAASALRERGYSVWFDEKLPVHRDYSDVIAEQLDCAAAVLVLWSIDASRSQWVRSEANRARETARLVQARLDASPLPMPFDQIQCADLSHGWPRAGSREWESVLSAIATLNGEEHDRTNPARPGRAVSRRMLVLGGLGAAAAAGAGTLAWKLRPQPSGDPRAQLLLQKGIDELQSQDALEIEDPPSEVQAIALLTQATRADPGSATAWGALALAYAVQKRASAPSERPGLAARSRSAAGTALELDPTDPRASAALLLVEPLYRNWIAAERADRTALNMKARHPILVSIMADMLGSVGRWRDAAAVARNIDRTNFLIAGAERKLVLNLWSAGDLAGADDALDSAVEHWPQHPQIWRTRVAYLMFSGRPAEALKLIDDQSDRPPELDARLLRGMRTTAQALAGQGGTGDAMAANLAYLNVRPAAALQVAQASAALGATDEALAILMGYYFGEGRWAATAPRGGDEDRLTNALFQPPMRSLWPNPRFGTLLQRIGLEDYWRQSHTIPDFRRPR